MKSVSIVWMVLALHLSCNAKATDFSRPTAADRLKIECGYDLGEEITREIISEEIKEGVFDSAKYVNFDFRINLRILQKEVAAKIVFNCIDEGSPVSYKKSLTPVQLMRQEDAGGRYFRHVAWQRKIHGRNWSGLIAYSDYLFGDGQKTPTYTYLICRAQSLCFNFEIDPRDKLTSREREAVLDLIKGISYEK